MQIKKRLLPVIAATFGVAVCSFSSIAQQDSLILKKTVSNYADYGYIASQKSWTNRLLFSSVITVCWENPTEKHAYLIRVVQDAIHNSWEANSLLYFNWQSENCASKSANIRVRIDDSGPHTKGLGTDLDGTESGMILNFEFQNWGAACAAPDRRERCIRSIAVHEFGHALGFSHEQNRPDTPGHCLADPNTSPQGPNGTTLLTPWDAHSVMNYCNPVYNNDGKLSDLDVQALQSIYGRRR